MSLRYALAPEALLHSCTPLFSFLYALTLRSDLYALPCMLYPLCASTLYAHLPKSIWGPGNRFRAELAHPSTGRGPVAPRTRKFGAGGCAAATVTCAGARLRSFWRGCQHATTPSLSLSLLPRLSTCTTYSTPSFT